MKNRIPQINHREPTHECVAALAYLIWEKEGCPNGQDAEHWNQAETQLRAARLAELKKSATTENRLGRFARLQTMSAII